ncbi:MAG: mechanosensitive ion channel family protein [Candidatus Omnitrophota bacterium]
MITILGLQISLWIYIPLAYLLWVLLWLLVKRVVFAGIKHLTERTKTRIDDILIHAADLPLFLLILSSGSIFMQYVSPLAVNSEMTRYFLLGFKAIIILAIALFVDRLIRGVIIEYTPKNDMLKASSGIVKAVARIFILGIGALILIDSFGISITPILASLGIGSLAVALALQPTLENFFSGIQLISDKPIRVGQFIKLETGQEGYVEKIGWRSTWIKMLPNNTVILPNKTIANSIVTNYDYPNKEVAVLVDLGVHYKSDLEKVERVTIDVGRDVMKTVSGGVVSFEPFIRYHTFSDSSINFTVILRAKEFVDNYLIKHEFIKKLNKRYTQEGIVIPYPIRATNLDQEKAFAQK